MKRYRLTSPSSGRYVTLVPGTSKTEAEGWSRFTGWTLTEVKPATDWLADTRARRTQYHAA